MKSKQMTLGIIIGIIVLVIVTVKLYMGTSNPEQAYSTSNDPSTVDQTVLDSAVGFGYKLMWFAVKTDNMNRLAEILNLKNVSDCNWKVGINKAYDASVFITPTIQGWTLACGWGLPHGDSEESVEIVKAILETMSKEFGEAQFFSNHRVTGFTCWMHASNGKINRVYSFAAELGENIVVEGEPTSFEKTLNLGNSFSEEAKDPKYNERMDIVWPDDELLMQVAEQWSINPTKLEERNDIQPGLGLLGHR